MITTITSPDHTITWQTETTLLVAIAQSHTAAVSRYIHDIIHHLILQQGNDKINPNHLETAVADMIITHKGG